ncbi:MAG: glycosyltransferase family 2 protein [Phormidesmis sp.]
MPCSVPIIFLIFRRPKLTAQVFEAIRSAKPTKLFIVADGPRDKDDILLCQQARAVTENIDWDCDVLRNYATENMGCRRRVSTGISWAFQEVEEAIILEDDCLPNYSFFNFCQALLEYYRHDNRIWMISGNNFQDGVKKSEFSYFFSKYPFIWGWATWKRAWNNYDANFDSWSEEYALQIIHSVCEDPDEEEFRLQRFRDVAQGRLDSWDPRWLFTCWANNALCVIPEKNLVSNIGFGAQATHTFNTSFPYANIKYNELLEIDHPQHVFRNVSADKYSYNHFFGGLSRKSDKSLRQKLLYKLKTLFRKIKILFQHFVLKLRNLEIN